VWLTATEAKAVQIAFCGLAASSSNIHRSRRLQNTSIEQLFCLRHITILEPWQGRSDGRSFPGQKAATCNAIVLIECPCLRNWAAKLLLSARKLPIRTVSITRSFPYNHAIYVREQLLHTSVWAAHAAYLLLSDIHGSHICQ
jgi:hypothetical protein